MAGGPFIMISTEASSVRIVLLEGPWSCWEGLPQGLRDAGLDLSFVSRDSRALLECLSLSPPEVAILDVTGGGDGGFGLSSQQGLELLSEVRRRKLEVRPLLVSANEPRFVAECFEEGAAGYLVRGNLSAAAVAGAVRALARGERLYPAELMHSDESPYSTYAADFAVLASLTTREREVLTYVAGGADNLKIAAHLRIAERTVKSHVTQLYRKLGSENRAQLALTACHMGVRPPANL